MDADTARRLFFQGATVVLLGAPAGTEVGLDYQVWAVTARFQGIKMIPPGVHCLFYRCGRATPAALCRVAALIGPTLSAVSRHGAVGPRHCQVLDLQSQQACVPPGCLWPRGG
jgi:hypothetical protein